MNIAGKPILPAVLVRMPDPCIYPNSLKAMDCFTPSGQPSPMERLMTGGLDEKTADAYLKIVDAYEQAVAAAESGYTKAVIESQDPLEILEAYQKRINDYDKAARTVQEQVQQLARQAGCYVAYR